MPVIGAPARFDHVLSTPPDAEVRSRRMLTARPGEPVPTIRTSAVLDLWFAHLSASTRAVSSCAAKMVSRPYSHRRIRKRICS